MGEGRVSHLIELGKYAPGPPPREIAKHARPRFDEAFLRPLVIVSYVMFSLLDEILFRDTPRVRYVHKDFRTMFSRESLQKQRSTAAACTNTKNNNNTRRAVQRIGKRRAE